MHALADLIQTLVRKLFTKQRDDRIDSEQGSTPADDRIDPELFTKQRDDRIDSEQGSTPARSAIAGRSALPPGQHRSAGRPYRIPTASGPPRSRWA